MQSSHFLLLPPAFAVGWLGTRMALHLHRTRDSHGETLFMLILCWSPSLICLLSMLLTLNGRTP
jgi:hypothetical protein